MFRLHYLLADTGLALISLSVASGLLLMLAKRYRAFARWYRVLRWIHFLSGGGVFLIYLLTYTLAPRF
ncbi:hypothetical protein LR090_07675 [Candidatus Bipolaricaulota bacterium]|nr:hypothetical protein [Candidatus Bipolaricaulota bacterium]